MKDNSTQTEKRAHKRVRSNLYARFFYNKDVHTGIIMNISKNGIFIKTRKYIPVRMQLNVLIPLIEEVLKLSVEVNRLIKIDDRYNGLGIEIFDPPGNYLEFVENMRT